METCPRCHYLTPPQAFNCPQCHAPLLHAAAAASPYSGVSSVYAKRRSKNPLYVLIGAAVLLALVALVVTSGSKEHKAADLAPIDAPPIEGWYPFRPDDSAFRVEFPTRPQRNEQPLPGLARSAVTFETKYADLRFRVIQQPAPEFVPSYQVAGKLAEWFRPVFEVEGSTLESSIQLVSPKGDQVFDAVVINADGRNWIRTAMWKGSLLFVMATGDASKPPTTEQIDAWRRFRDSLSQ